jgi:hypothetical protein
VAFEAAVALRFTFSFLVDFGVGSADFKLLFGSTRVRPPEVGVIDRP